MRKTRSRKFARSLSRFSVLRFHTLRPVSRRHAEIVNPNDILSRLRRDFGTRDFLGSSFSSSLSAWCASWPSFLVRVAPTHDSTDRDPRDREEKSFRFSNIVSYLHSYLLGCKTCTDVPHIYITHSLWHVLF